MKKTHKNNLKPKWLLTYWCWECSFETHLNDLDEAKCDMCSNTDKLLIISREKSTKNAIDKKIIKINDQFIESLEGDIDSGFYDFSLEKKELIEKLEKAKKLKNLLEAGNVTYEEIEKYIK